MNISIMTFSSGNGRHLRQNCKKFGFPTLGKKPLLFATMIFLILIPAVHGDINFFGYYENRLFVIDNRTVSFSNFDYKFNLGDYNRLRLMMNASPAERVTINLAVDLFSFHGFIRSPIGSSNESSVDDSYRITFDRLFADLHFKHVDISIGHQRIPLGVSYLWAPLDIFGRINLFEPKEEKPGVNAVKAYIPLGISSSITAVFSPNEQFSSSTSALRVQTTLFGVDGALTFISRAETDSSITGVDLRGENLIGWWFEAAFSRGSDKADRIVVGFDATFPLGTGLYWLNEFYYDSSGAAEENQYDFLALENGDRSTLGRSYLLSMLRMSITQLSSTSFSYVGNFNDGSFMLGPSVNFEISQNVSLSSGLYLPFGSEESEFGRSRMSLFYLWLKINF